MSLPARIAFPYRLNPAHYGCPDCFGTGNNAGVACSTCLGSGVVTEDQEAAWFGELADEESPSALDLAAEAASAREAA